MVDRLMMHLKPEELMEYFDGTLDDRRVCDHLSTCFQCRSRLKDLSLTRIMLSPPRAEAPGEHIPSEIMAQYIEDTLSMEQNRAVEDHLSDCRRCLADLVSLRTTASMPLDKAPPEAVAAGVKEHLDEYRRVTPLGSLSFKLFRDEINLAYKPIPDKDDPEAYSEQSAKYRFPFKKGADFKSRVEDMARKTRLEVQADMLEDAAPVPVSAFEAGEMLQRRMPKDPSDKMVSTDTAVILFSLDERGGKRILTIQVRDFETIELLPDVEITLIARKEDPITVTTDHSGTAVLEVPEGPSTLRIHLEKIYELTLSSLL